MIEAIVTKVTDPVCGMSVTIEHAEAAALAADHDGVRYFFCGKGCLLDFQDEPAKYLDPAYRPTM